MHIIYLNQKYLGLRRFSIPNEEGKAKEGERCTRERIRLLKAILSKLKVQLDQTGTRGIVFHAWEELSRTGYLNDADMPVLDLYPALSERSALEDVDVLYRDEGHRTPEGHRIIADKLSRALRRAGYVDAKSDVRARR